MSVIGTWRDEIRIDQEVRRYARAYAEATALNIERDVCGNCPTKCIEWDGNELTIDDSNCVKCMHCINAMPKALRPGTDTGATILVGSKAPIVEGAQLSSVLIPFMKMEPPYDEI
jgi:dissimilatory sulfite reductase alpha subunit